MDNLYTFYIPAASVSPIVWRHFLDPEKKWYDLDSISVYLNGDTGRTGGHFRIARRYRYENIRIDSDLVPDEFNANSKKRKWKYFGKGSGKSQPEYVNSVIAELRDIASEKIERL